MKIRTQIVISLVPLFAGFALVMGALLYYLQMRELRWGLEEEASSIAVSAACFVSGDNAAGDIGNAVSVSNILHRISAAGKARRVTLLSADGRTILSDVPTSKASAATVAAPAGVVAEFADVPYVVDRVRRGRNGEYLLAWAPVRDKVGNVKAVLAVETDAGAAGVARKELLGFLVVPLAGSVLTGLLLALVIARIITLRLEKLAHAVSRVESGKYDEQPSDGMVEELNDLGNTFDTMRSVLNEVVSRRWREIIETEQFRAEGKEDMMCAFKARFQAPSRRTVLGVDVSGTLLGCRSMGGFHGMWESNGAGWALVGNITTSNIMDEVTVASAACSYIEQAMKHGDTQAALKTATDIFALAGCVLVTWKPNSRALEAWILDAGSKQWRQEAMTLEAGETRVFHTLDEHADLRIRTYVRQFGNLPQDDLVKEIQNITSEQSGGSLVLLRAAS